MIACVLALHCEYFIVEAYANHCHIIYTCGGATASHCDYIVEAHVLATAYISLCRCICQPLPHDLYLWRHICQPLQLQCGRSVLTLLIFHCGSTYTNHCPNACAWWCFYQPCTQLGPACADGQLWRCLGQPCTAL